MVKVTDRDDWFDLWFTDKQDILSTMHRNIQDDINAGWSFKSNAIQKQYEDINEYMTNFHEQMDRFYLLSDEEVNRWCFYDMKKRGVIE